MLHIVKNLDDLCAMRDWAYRQPVMALDTETTGFDTYAHDFKVRTVQFGNCEEAWVIPFDGWERPVAEIIDRFDGRLLIHNSRYDIEALAAHGVKVPWHKVDDTMIAMRLAEPHYPAGLKEAAGRHVSAAAARSQKDLHKAMRSNKWDWATVPLDFPPYLFYAAMDVILTCRLDATKACTYGRKSPVYGLEMDLREVCTEMERNGMRIDLNFCQSTMLALLDEAESIKDAAQRGLGINLMSNAELGRWLIGAGAKLTVTTEKGAPSVSRDSLELCRLSSTGMVSDVIDEALRVRKILKLAHSYFENFINLSTDGLLHPSIETIAAKTGRMCLPDDHQILTERGVLDINDVLVGDRTLDEHGDWVDIEAIHRYADQPVQVWESSILKLESTSEHRWVTYSERGVRRLEPLSGARRLVRLAPETIFDPHETVPVYEKGNLAALIGWLVSDGHCSNTGGELRAYLYQTERKFLTQMRHAIPEDGFMYDRITNDGDHHEVRLKTRWLRPILDELGLSTDPKNDPMLPRWVSTLPLHDCHAFLQAVWLADGSTAWPRNQKISCDSAPLREAIQIAAYRCGKASHVTNDGLGGWATKDRLGVKMKRPVAYTRNMSRSERQSDVWCVTTSSGTFTAWKNGPYLTGNSIRNPALQTLPRGEDSDSKMVRTAVIPRDPDHMLIACDYSQIELRIIAALSGDEDLQNAFHTSDAAGSDFFTEATRAVYEDAAIPKSDPRRTGVKTLFYASGYGAGIAKMAATAGMPVDDMKVVSDRVFSRYPGVKRLMKACQRTAKENDNWITTPAGRKIWIDPDRGYAAMNGLVQGHAADVFKRATVEMAHAGLSQFFVVPVHDEMLLSVPKEDIDEVSHLVGEIMTDKTTAVPLLAEPGDPAMTWAEAK